MVLNDDVEILHVWLVTKLQSTATFSVRGSRAVRVFVIGDFGWRMIV